MGEGVRRGSRQDGISRPNGIHRGQTAAWSPTVSAENRSPAQSNQRAERASAPCTNGVSGINTGRPPIVIGPQFPVTWGRLCLREMRTWGCGARRASRFVRQQSKAMGWLLESALPRRRVNSTQGTDAHPWNSEGQASSNRALWAVLTCLFHRLFRSSPFLAPAEKPGKQGSQAARFFQLGNAGGQHLMGADELRVPAAQRVM